MRGSGCENRERATGRGVRDDLINIRMALALLCCASLFCACAGPRDEAPKGITLRLTRADGAAVADADVEVLPENPPGGRLARRSDAQGRVGVPAEYAGLRVMIGTDCRPASGCRHFSTPYKLEGDAVTINVEGALNFPPPASSPADDSRRDPPDQHERRED